MTRVQCVKYRRKDTIRRKVLEQERRKILCPECRIEKKKPWQNWGVVACSIEGKMQQGSAWTGVLKSTVKEENKKRDVRRTFKILREVWLNIGIEKVDTHEGITVKALLDSSTTGMFMDRKMAARNEFKL